MEEAFGQSRTRRRLWIITGIIAIIAFLYFVPDLFVAYTEDAYVRPGRRGRRQSAARSRPI
jgi:hypothetical protein